jgi:hypothetical protein
MGRLLPSISPVSPSPKTSVNSPVTGRSRMVRHNITDLMAQNIMDNNGLQDQLINYKRKQILNKLFKKGTIKVMQSHKAKKQRFQENMNDLHKEVRD